MAGTVAQRVEPLHETSASHLGAGSGPSCSMSDPAPCQWAGESTEDGAGTHMGDLNGALAPDFSHAQHWPLWPSGE